MVIDLARARLVAARRVCNMDVAELVAVCLDGIADAALVELHVIDIIEHLEHRGTDQSGDLRSHLGMCEEVAHMVGGDVQRLEVHCDAALLCDLGAVQQHVVHRAQLDRIGQVVIVIDNDAAVAQGVRVDGHALGADLLCRRNRLAQEVQVLFLVVSSFEIPSSFATITEHITF